MTETLAVLPEVADALADGRPVVALETTVVTHGLPSPTGLEVAAEMESLIREGGAVPATIALLEGRARIGLRPEDLQRLANIEAEKVNLGNLAAVLAAGKPGSTTVAATLALAHRVGIKVFATGGIGGVHRDAAETGDVSADLTALARYPIAVVCSGAKAVLDLPKTVEALETLGVPVLGHRTPELPAFYRRASGLAVDARCDGADELARAIAAHLELGGGTGVVVANPIPVESEMSQSLYDRALAGALSELERTGGRGRAVTPFLLDALDRLTEGRSVTCNRALLLDNARLAGRLAVELG